MRRRTYLREALAPVLYKPPGGFLSEISPVLRLFFPAASRVEFAHAARDGLVVVDNGHQTQDVADWPGWRRLAGLARAGGGTERTYPTGGVLQLLIVQL